MKARILLLIAALILTACGGGTPTPAPTNTLAPTLPPVPNLSTPAATSQTQPTIAPTTAATESAVTPTVEATNTATGPVTDRAEFVSDVTVPDGTDYAPGATFTKTWRIKNVGTSTWTKDYALEFASGTNMAGATSVNLPGDVSPGGIIDISINMTAPSALGSYVSSWQFRTPGGSKFGVGPNFNEIIYLQIDVVQGGSTGNTSGNGQAATAAPTASGPLNPAKVTKVTLSVNTANVQNDCPHTFVFTALLNIEGGGVVKYQLEASSSTPGFTFSLPAPIESTFTTNGPHTFGVSYTLEMRNAVAGEAWLHVLSPNELTSEKVPFSLTCPPTATFAPQATATSAVTVTATP